MDQPASKNIKTARPRSAKNLYLDSEVADKAANLAKNSKHKSLSGLTEHLLKKEIERIDRAKAKKKS